MKIPEQPKDQDKSNWWGLINPRWPEDEDRKVHIGVDFGEPGGDKTVVSMLESDGKTMWSGSLEEYYRKANPWYKRIWHRIKAIFHRPRFSKEALEPAEYICPIIKNGGQHFSPTNRFNCHYCGACERCGLKHNYYQCHRVTDSDISFLKEVATMIDESGPVTKRHWDYIRKHQYPISYSVKKMPKEREILLDKQKGI